MADNKKYYWLKLKRDFFKRHDVRIIEEMPNGKDYILFYLKMLLESIDHEGELRFSETIPYNEQMLSVITNTNIDIVRSAMKVFIDLNLIEIFDDSTIYMAEVQKLIGSETASASRMRRHRENRLLSQCDTKVTKSDTEKEKDKEIHKDIEKREESEREKSLSLSLFEKLIPGYNFSNTIKAKVSEWLIYKIECGAKSYQEQGLKALLTRIENNVKKYGERAVCDLIDDCMANGWKGIIFDKLSEKEEKAIKQGKTDIKRYGDFDPAEAFERALQRSYSDDDDETEAPKTIGTDDNVRERAEALREKLST